MAPNAFRAWRNPFTSAFVLQGAPFGACPAPLLGRGMSTIRARRKLARLATLAGVVAVCLGAANEPDGLHAKPHLGVRSGDHHADLRLEFRYRYEDWKAFAPHWSDFHGVRTRFALDYRYADRLRVFAQGQQTAVMGLASDASGAGRLYRANNGDNNTAGSVRPSQLFAELTPTPETSILLGRSYLNVGTSFSYAEPHWRFLRLKRLSQRLVGAVDWTQGARAADGVSARLAYRGHRLHAFAAQPTTGVFVVDEHAYKRQKDVLFAGLHWTAERGTLLQNTELGGFFIAYRDDRDPAEVAGLFGEIELYTLGGSWLGVYPLGPGRVDALLWAAIQVGDYEDIGPTSGVRTRDQLAGAVVAEFGYQLPEVWSRPWLRAGVNWGSGDGDPNDDERHTFFNLLPTNHLYYGYADQLALQNLVDLLFQLKLEPHPRVGIELTFHRFWLHDDDDFRWAGTGAFSRRNLGYARSPSNGSSDVGRELDVIAELKLAPGVVLSGGFARLWGGDVFDGQRRRDVRFGYVQLAFSY